MSLFELLDLMCPQCGKHLDSIAPEAVRYACGHTEARSEYDQRKAAARAAVPTPQAQNGTSVARPRLRVVQLSTVQPKEVEFLSGDYIPVKMVGLVVGDPGLGKTRILLDLGAAVTCGRAWPEGDERTEPANVLFCGYEDTLEHVIRPVFDALGGDASRFFHIDALISEARDGSERESAFALTPDGLEALEAAIVEYRPRLLLIDPITGHLGNVNTFKDSEVRAVLMPLGRLAEKYGVAVVGNAHMNKATQQAVAYRIGASIAFRAVARSVFYVAPDPNDPNGYRHLLFHDKSNVAVKRPPRGYAILEKDGVGVVAWDREPVMCTLAEALSAGPGQTNSRHETEAERFLKELLASGPVDYAKVKEASGQRGIKERTLDRAKRSLGVRSIKQGYGKDQRTLWALPNTDITHGVPTMHSSHSMAPNGTHWHPLTAEVIPFPSKGRQRMPTSAVNTKDANGGTPCTFCDKPASHLLNDDTPLCTEHYGQATRKGR